MSQSKIITSVIIPVYNTEQYLKACVESVLAQTQKDIEIILVDDGSTDKSGQIIKEYEEKYSCVKAIHQENQKLGAARNTGVEQAIGKYLYFLDSDDYISEELLETCYQEAERNRLDFVMFDAEVFVEEEGAGGFREGSVSEEYGRSNIGIEDKVYAGKEFWEKFCSRRGICSNAYLTYINAGFFRKNRLFFEPGVFYEDMDWVVRLYSCAERIAYIPRKLYYRRIHTGSIMTVNYSDTHVKSCIFMCGKMLQMFLDEDDVAKQDMIRFIFRAMIGRFKDIFKLYSAERRVEGVRSEFIGFYDLLLTLYKDICAQNIDLGIELLVIAENIRERLHGADIEEERLDLQLEEDKLQLIRGELQGFPLNREGQSVGIYGTGLVCERFLSLYQMYVAEISASIFFIDTHPQNRGYYQDRPIYNISDIADMKLDCIIIASTRYREEMLDKVRQYYPLETNVMVVPGRVSTLYGLWADQMKDRMDKEAETIVCHREVTG